MIELDIKIRANNDESFRKLLSIMTESLSTPEVRGERDITLNAGIDKDNMITVNRREVTKWTRKM